MSNILGFHWAPTTNQQIWFYLQEHIKTQAQTTSDANKHRTICGGVFVIPTILFQEFAQHHPYSTLYVLTHSSAHVQFAQVLRHSRYQVWLFFERLVVFWASAQNSSKESMRSSRFWITASPSLNLLTKVIDIDPRVVKASNRHYRRPKGTSRPSRRTAWPRFLPFSVWPTKSGRV